MGEMEEEQKAAERLIPSASVSMTIVCGQTKKTLWKDYLAIKKLKQRAKDGHAMINKHLYFDF